MSDNSNQTGGRSHRGETARDLVAQSMYALVRLARLGLEAATSGVSRLEASMARKQLERPTHEARPKATSSRQSGEDVSGPSGVAGEASEKGAEAHRPGTDEISGPSKH